MKKILYLGVVFALLYGCNQGGLTKKDFTGTFIATVKVDTAQIPFEERANLEMMMNILAMSKITYTFKEDGSGVYSAKMGEMGNEMPITWEIKGKDSLQITGDGKVEMYPVVKTEKGLKLVGGKGVDVELEKEAMK